MLLVGAAVVWFALDSGNLFTKVVTIAAASFLLFLLFQKDKAGR
jgi:hypothetical protein